MIYSIPTNQGIYTLENHPKKAQSVNKQASMGWPNIYYISPLTLSGEIQPGYP